MVDHATEAERHGWPREIGGFEVKLTHSGCYAYIEDPYTPGDGWGKATVTIDGIEYKGFGRYPDDPLFLPPAPVDDQEIAALAERLRSLAWGSSVFHPDDLLTPADALVRLFEETRQLRGDRDALARIVGDLWDDPPEGSTVSQYAIHVEETYSSEDAAVWRRLFDRAAGPAWDNTHGWAIADPGGRP